MNQRHSHRSETGIVEQLLAESVAMAKYALASGLKVPASVLHVVATAEEELQTAAGAPREHAQDISVETPAARKVLDSVTSAHHQLAQIVAPATPRTLLLLSRERRDTRLPFLGPVRLVRQMMLVAIVLLATFILTALSPEVNDSSGDIFRSSGTELLINELFLLSAAGVGAAFTSLFRANRYIALGTYDPKYESSYWVRFILGLIAGIVLPALIPVESSQALTRPLLALIGGFSASVVYRILSRLVDTLESFIQGDTRELITAREQVLNAQASEQRAQEQLRLAAGLIKLREQVEGGSGVDQIKVSLSKIIDELAPRDFAPSAEPPPQASESQRPRPVVVN